MQRNILMVVAKRELEKAALLCQRPREIRSGRIASLAAICALAIVAVVCGSPRSEASLVPAAQQASPAQAGEAQAAPAPPVAQQPAATEQPTIKADVKIVSVLATVRDKKGKIVPDLKKENFVLTEDGRPETISYFAAETDVPLTMGLLVDTSMSQRNVLGQERDASQVFLDHSLRQDKDKAFLIQFAREVELLQDITASRDKLEKALQSLSAPEFSNTRGQGSPSDDGGDSQARRGGGTLLYDAIYLASNELMLKQKGRKALVVLTDGVDRGSKVSLIDAIESAQHADTLVYSILFADHDEGGYGGHHGGFGGPGMGRGGGMGWPGGAGGGQGRPREQRPDGKKILERISHETGGRMFEVTKKETVDHIYAEIGEELRNQYSLGYTPTPTDAGPGYRKIVLTTTQKDLVVQARDGYYADK
ncbi:MAG: VWA domain-containing protein [Candidatus Acidiferrales bacterium]